MPPRNVFKLLGPTKALAALSPLVHRNHISMSNILNDHVVHDFLSILASSQRVTFRATEKNNGRGRKNSFIK
jgi:hypothetical protein